jgi:hypothetical protein
MEEPRGPRALRLWSRGRTELAFVTKEKGKAESARHLFPILAKGAASEKDLRLRAAALHALRFYFFPETAELALAALEDPQKEIREAARGTLQRIAKASDQSAADLRKWWNGLDKTEREAQLLRNFTDRN